jgi:hypothetical protein
MQKEHVVYALTGLAVDFAELGRMAKANELMYMASVESLVTRFAALLNEANEDELVNDLISKRVVEEQRARTGR